MTTTVGDHIMQRLADGGVEWVFGFPGDGINGIYGLLGGSYQQEVDLHNLFKDVAGRYVQTITVPEQVRHVVDRAVRIAASQRTVTCIIVPNDVQELEAVETPPRAHGTVHSGAGYSRPVVVPEPADLRRAADVLNSGEKVAMLIGAGALQASGDQALSADRPVVLEALADPNLPPLPPHPTLEQVRAYLSSIIHGDPDRSKIIKASARQMLDTLVPEVRK
jgi:thiamine pyrophosphate-dependent acetolactate synthase large subunit-like protein